MIPQPDPQFARAEDEHGLRQAMPNLYGELGGIPGLSEEARQELKAFQASLTNTIVSECGKDIARRGKSTANWYLAFAQGLDATVPLQQAFIRDLKAQAEQTQDPAAPVDLHGLDAACRQSVNATTRLAGLLREQAAKSA